MSSDWKTLTLNEIVNFGNGKARPKTEGNIPIYGGNGVLGYSGDSNYKDETIIIGRVGAYCGATYFENNPIWVSDNALSAKAKKGFIAKYAYYVLKSKNLNQYAQGSSHPLLTQGLLNKLEAYVTTDIELQEKIVSIIGDIEDKIEVNTQTNQTLEQIAQAIFKSWFVDFDPVKAKIETLAAGGSDDDAELAAMSVISAKTLDELNSLKANNPVAFNKLAQTAALFPAAMQDSELGEIPEGWSVLSLDEVANYQNGLALQKFRPEDESDFLPVVKIAQLKKGFTDGEEKATPKIKPECIIDDGDVIFSWSGSLIVDIWCGGKAALNQHLFKVTSQKYPKWLYYYFTIHHLAEFQRIAADKAVTMGHIKREHLSSAKCAIPSNDLIVRSSALIGSILNKKIEQRLEAKSLAELRDALLPKLLSGEINVTSEVVE